MRRDEGAEAAGIKGSRNQHLLSDPGSASDRSDVVTSGELLPSSDSQPLLYLRVLCGLAGQTQDWFVVWRGSVAPSTG